MERKDLVNRFADYIVLVGTVLDSIGEDNIVLVCIVAVVENTA